MPVKKKVDVIVLGAGPAGLSVASELAEKTDYGVLVFDRKEELGFTTRSWFLPTFFLDDANPDVAQLTYGDLNGDGDLDAFVVNHNAGNRVWLNDGSGVFADTAQSLGGSSTYGVSLGDVDGDGDLDAFVADFTQPNRVYLND